MFWGEEILTLSVSGAVYIEARGGKCVDPRLGGVALVCRNGATSFVFRVIPGHGLRGPALERHASYVLPSPAFSISCLAYLRLHG